MKNIVVLFVVCCAVCVNAANIRWNCFVQTKNYYTGDPKGSFEYLGFEDEGVPSVIMPTLDVQVFKQGGNIVLDGSMSSFYLAFIGVWLEKSYGDVIDFSTMSGRRGEYFAATSEFSTFGQDQFKTVEATPGDTVYLAVMQSGYETSSPDGKYYGWIELLVGNEGDLTLMRSAFAIDGSPLIVGGGAVGGDGAIPEPSVAVLLLVGAGLLGLRRRKEEASEGQTLLHGLRGVIAWVGFSVVFLWPVIV